MSVPLRYDQLDPQRQAAISANIAKMRAAKAPDADVERYLTEHEKLAPVSPPRRVGPGFASEATAAAPDQAGRRAAMAAQPPILSSGLPRELEQGATLGFGDEINAGARALFTKESYGQALQNERGIMHAYESAHPVVSIGAQLAGGAGALGLAGAGARTAAAAPSFVGRVVGAAKTGAGIGAVAGAGNAEGGVGSRVVGAVKGAAAGAIAAPIASEIGGRIIGADAADAPGATGKALQAAPRRVGPISDGRQSVELPLPRRIARRVGLPSDADRGDAVVLNTITKGGKSIEDLRAAAASASPDKPFTLADIAGEGAQQLVSGAQTYTNAAAATKVPEILKDRMGNQLSRVSDDLANASGVAPTNPFELAKQMEKTRNSMANQQFSEARAQGAVDHPAVNDILKKPWFADAYKDAQKLAKLSGKKLPEISVPGEETPIVFQGVPLLDADGNPKTYQGAPTTKTVPTVEALDYVRRVIQDKVNRGFAQGGPQSAVAHELQGPLAELTNAMRTAVPVYGQALDNYSAASRMMDALQKGREALGQDPRQAKLIHDALETPHEQELFRAGLQDSQRAAMAKTNKASTVLPADRGDEWRKQQIALGAKDPAAGAEAVRRSVEERQMLDNNKRMLGNSTTVNKAAARSDIDAAGPDLPGNVPLSPKQLVRYTWARVVNYTRGLNANTADAVANRLLSGATNRQELLDALDELDALKAKGQLTPTKTRELLKLPAATQAARIGLKK